MGEQEGLQDQVAYESADCQGARTHSEGSRMAENASCDGAHNKMGDEGVG